MLCIAPLKASTPHGPLKESSPSALYLEQRGTDWEAGGGTRDAKHTRDVDLLASLPFPVCGTYIPHGGRVPKAPSGAPRAESYCQNRTQGWKTDLEP